MKVCLWGTSSTSPLFHCTFSITSPLVQTSCGEKHSAFLTEDGLVYTLNHQVDSPTLRPAPISLPVIKQLSCGWYHTLALSLEGQAFAWGTGDYGALGLGSTDSTFAPTPVPLAMPVANVQAGSRHSAFLMNSRQVFMCGAGEFGQLGLGTRTSQVVPTQVPLEGVIQVGCGLFHTGFVLDNGRLLTTGGNSFGQLGIGSKQGVLAPVVVRTVSGVVKISFGGHSACVTRQGNLYVWGGGPWGEYLTPEKVMEEFEEIETGGTFGLCRCFNGHVYRWGSVELREDSVFEIQVCEGSEKTSSFACSNSVYVLCQRETAEDNGNSAIQCLSSENFRLRQTINWNKDEMNGRINELQGQFRDEIEYQEKLQLNLQSENQDLHRTIEELRTENQDWREKLAEAYAELREKQREIDCLRANKEIVQKVDRVNGTRGMPLHAFHSKVSYEAARRASVSPSPLLNLRVSSPSRKTPTRPFKHC